jgi:hypothetical protein
MRRVFRTEGSAEDEGYSHAGKPVTTRCKARVPAPFFDGFGGAAKNSRSRVLALMVACCALNFGSIVATVPGAAAPTSSELLEQGRKLIEAGKLAEAELATLCRDGQIERGAEELRKALALNPEDRDAAKALEAIRVLNKTE